MLSEFEDSAKTWRLMNKSGQLRMQARHTENSPGKASILDFSLCSRMTWKAFWSKCPIIACMCSGKPSVCADSDAFARASAWKPNIWIISSTKSMIGVILQGVDCCRDTASIITMAISLASFNKLTSFPWSFKEIIIKRNSLNEEITISWVLNVLAMCVKQGQTLCSRESNGVLTSSRLIFRCFLATPWKVRRIVAITQISPLIREIRLSSAFWSWLPCKAPIDSNTVSMHSIVGPASVARDSAHWSGGNAANTLVIPVHNAFVSSIYGMLLLSPAVDE